VQVNKSRIFLLSFTSYQL